MMKNRNMKKVWCLSLVMSLLISLCTPAFATESSGEIEVGSEEDFVISVDYLIREPNVIEEITISEEGVTPIVIEKVIHLDGEMEVYINGALTNVVSGICYEMYLNAAQGECVVSQYLQNELMTVEATNPCGFDDAHTAYGSPLQYTVNIDSAVNSAAQATTLILISMGVPAVSEYFVNLIYEDIQAAFDNGADYVDIRETRFTIMPEGYSETQICCHVFFAFYNLRSDGSKNYVVNRWHFYQTPM